MKRLALVFLLSWPVVLAFSAGAVALASSDSRVTDSDVYLVVTWHPEETQAELADLGLKPLGPVTAPFGFFVQADQGLRRVVRSAGHLIIPAGVIASICGINTSGIRT